MTSRAQLSKEVKFTQSSVFWKSVLFLSGISIILLYWIFMTASAVMVGDYFAAVALAIVSVSIFWSIGSLYVSVPLSLYFHSKYHSDRNYAAIDRVHRRALKLLMKLPLRRSMSVVVTMSNLGLLRLCQGEYESAVSLYSEAAGYLEKNRRLRRSATAVVIYNNLAVAQIRINDYFEAESTALKALEIAESAPLQKKHSLFAAAPLAALASIRLRLGELENAVEYYTKALSLSESAPLPPGTASGSFDQCRLFIFLGLATATIKLDRKQESEQWCKRAWSIVRTNHKLANALALDSLNVLANEYMDRKMFEPAEALLELAYSIGQESPFHPDAKKLLSYYEKLFILTDRQKEVSDMRSWLRHVEIKAISASP